MHSVLLVLKTIDEMYLLTYFSFMDDLKIYYIDTNSIGSNITAYEIQQCSIFIQLNITALLNTMIFLWFYSQSFCNLYCSNSKV